MNKSLEALERIETVFVYNKQRKKNCYADFMSESKVIEEYYKDYNTIKQELERLEHLDKENKELAEAIQLSNEYIAKVERIKVDLINVNKALKKSNKEIEELYLNENKHWCETIDSSRKEIKQFEKFIEWLKDDDGYLYIKPEILTKLKELKLYKEK